jgi:hypothetical protein
MKQLDFAITEEINHLSIAWGESEAEKGQVYTCFEVVDFMLCTSGISQSLLSSSTRILEPSCGEGEFIVAIANLLKGKLSESSAKFEVECFMSLVTAFEISKDSILVAKKAVSDILSECFSTGVKELVDSWFVNDDFLLYEHTQTYTHIVGNPPYVRIENIPKGLLEAYRHNCNLMVERADLYVGFYEKCLEVLATSGTLSFICTDRWVKNSYGGALRKFISQSFQLDMYVDLYGQQAFQSDVLTYPCITQISRNKQNKTLVIKDSTLTDKLKEQVITFLEGHEDTELLARTDIVNEDKPWLFCSCEEVDLVARLEQQFQLIESLGCKVFIGAATGNNKVYIVESELDIEACRKIPVVKASDLKEGVIVDSGYSLINTYDESGVINLPDYPLLEEYLLSHKEVLSKRHVAKKAPNYWYKTIDRVYPKRAKSEKLLIPDIKTSLTVIYDEGKYHPNNSIYYICSETWDLNALKAVLMSGIGQLFVEVYSTKVSGGHLRFQAQHLRRIVIPDWQHVNKTLKDKLVKAGKLDDLRLAQVAVTELYNLSEKDKEVLGY